MTEFITIAGIGTIAITIIFKIVHLVKS